ncbi:MAG TPA: hypothetical protein VGG63_16265 [Steroidobacteraceae bacterium]|jgi:hypothetical protein
MRHLMSGIIALGLMASCGAGSAQADAVRYFNLPAPQPILPDAQSWEGDQQPHTLSVLKLNRGGFKYWGWYGLNNGRGTGLARSNDLVHWTKYENNPLWLNARWTSAFQDAETGVLYFAITRDYDTPSSRIVLATSRDGIHLTEVMTLVQKVPRERNQNPDLFRDPVSGRFFLLFYRGNDTDYFDIVARSARRIEDLATAPDKLLLHTTETVAAPNLLYVPRGGPHGKGIYYLATEVYPNRYGKTQDGTWEVKVFHSERPDGDFEPVAGNPVQTGGRACLFQHIFGGKYYGYQSHLDPATDKWSMEALVLPLP